jgi:SAM-dependent methyltransferase
MGRKLMRNVDERTVADFGEEWTSYDQTQVPEPELRRRFDGYFRHFPWDRLPADPEGFDLGCGTGRWARYVAPRVGRLHCIEPSERALAVAERNLAEFDNCTFHTAAVDEIPLPDGSMDFGYSLGVLHHIPDTAAGIAACVAKLKPGAPFLVYLYYAFDNRPPWFRGLWRVSDLLRRGICRLPHRLKLRFTQGIAATVYWPLARTARAAEGFGVNVSNFPLTAYRDFSFYSMQTDALDRFGTRLEQRFTARQVREMMEACGLSEIRFNEEEHFWCAVGIKEDGPPPPPRPE